MRTRECRVPKMLESTGQIGDGAVRILVGTTCSQGGLTRKYLQSMLALQGQQRPAGSATFTLTRRSAIWVQSPWQRYRTVSSAGGKNAGSAAALTTVRGHDEEGVAMSASAVQSSESGSADLTQMRMAGFDAGGPCLTNPKAWQGGDGTPVMVF